MHKYIFKRHKELYLRGTVPELVNDNFFKRFDPDIIQQRKEFILHLLDFIAQHPSLYKSHSFIQFFEATHTPSVSPKKCSITADDGLIDVGIDEIDNAAPQLNVSVNHEQIHENDSITPENSSPSSSSILSETNSSCFSEPIVGAAVSTLSNSIDIIESIQPSSSDSPVPNQSTASTTTIIDTSAEYIFEAALQFSDAVRAEVNLDYLEAFERYKGGIEKLINGAKLDVCMERKKIAKEKTEKYLIRAEQIYEKYMLNGVNRLVDDQLASMIHRKTSEQSSISNNSSLIEMPTNQLSKFKVIKILDRVMQVQDVTDKKIYIMKVC